MRVVELTMQEFSDFAANHPLRNYCQTTTYAKLMGEKGFNYDYIGYKDDSSSIFNMKEKKDGKLEGCLCN